jgi:phage gpG-like protein
MPDPFEIPLMTLGRVIVALKPELVDAIGTEALVFIDDNFAKQGFQGATFIPWPKRRTKDKRGARALLVQTGTLRRSIVKNDSGDHTTIGTDIVYAKIHNEGGEINHPARKSILSYRQGKDGKLALAKRQTMSQKMKITDVRIVSIGAHSSKMPRRQFIPTTDSPSPILTQRCQKVLIQRITAALPQ